ncbi:MAG: ATP-binding protein [Gammaproteobacteria bacterium]|nr:ATP-binding protein [Gammaproteobacteria bacterium]
MTDTPPPLVSTRPRAWYRGLWILAACLCLALALLLNTTWQAATQLRNLQKTTIREQGGAHEVYTLYEAMVVLGRLRGATVMYLGGDASQAPIVEELHTEFRLLVRGILAEDHVRGFRIADALELALGRVQSMQTAVAHRDPIAAFQYLGEIELDLGEIMEKVAGFSDMKLDPEGNGNYLVDTMINTLPALTIHLDTLRGLLAYTDQSATHSAADTLLTLELLTYARKTQHSQRAATILHELGHPDHERTSNRLEGFERTLMDVIAKFAHLPGKSLALGRQAYTSTGAANTLLFDLYNEVYGDLHIHLQQRLDDAQRKLNQIYFSTAIALTLLALLAVLTALRIRTLHRVAQREHTRMELAQTHLYTYVQRHHAAADVGDYHFTNLALMPWLSATIGELSPLARQLDLRFELRNALPDAHIWADKPRITQALHHVLSCCAERSPSRSSVDIRVNKIDTDRICIIIKDHGVALTEAQQLSLFDPNLDQNENSASPGSCISLVIAKTIIIQHNGQVDVVSESESGTSFFIELPLVDARYTKTA